MTHHARAPDALDVSYLNLSDGGKGNVDRKMRDGWYRSIDGTRKTQLMRHPTGLQKGLTTILQERGLHLDSKGHLLRLQCIYCKNGDMSARQEAIDRGWIDIQCCARGVLSRQPDFLEQEEWLAEECKKQGLSIIFYPKYHCELNYIESVWGWLKSYHRRHCTFKYEALKAQLPITAKEKLPLEFIQRAERSAFRFMSGYRVGLEGPVLDYAMRLYHGHRQIPQDVVASINAKFEEKQRAMKR